MPRTDICGATHQIPEHNLSSLSLALVSETINIHIFMCIHTHTYVLANKHTFICKYVYIYLQINSWSLQTDIYFHYNCPWSSLPRTEGTLNVLKILRWLTDMKLTLVTLGSTQLPMQSLLMIQASFYPDKNSIVLT